MGAPCERDVQTVSGWLINADIGDVRAMVDVKGRLGPNGRVNVGGGRGRRVTRICGGLHLVG